MGKTTPQHVRHGWQRSLGPDPKPAPKVKNPEVYKQFHAANHRCLVCSAPNPNAAHLLGGPNREDVLAALVPLCGTGTSGCHGAWHGNAWTKTLGGKRYTPEFVKAAVGRWILSEDGQDACWYLTSKLGVEGSRAFVEKLGVDVA